MSTKTKVTVQVKEFKNIVATAARLVNRKNALPVLADLLLHYDGQGWTATTSNSEAWLTLPVQEMHLIEHRVDEKVQSPKALDFAVNAQQLLQTLQSLPDVVLQLIFDADARTVQIIYMTGEQTEGQMSMPTDEPAEYPQPATITEAEVEVTQPTATLLPMIRAARVAVAQDELRPVMETVCIDLTQEDYAVVASDGHMLVSDRHFCGAGYLKGAPQALKLHKSILDTLLTAFATQESMTIRATANLMSVEGKDGLRLVCRPIDARYPNWQSVIPQNQPMKVTLAKDALIQTVRRVSPFANDSSNMIRLAFNGDVLTVTAQDFDFQRAAEEQLTLQDTNISGEFSIGVKAATLLTVLGVVKTENIHLLLADPSRAMVIKEEDVQSGFTGLTMPMLLNE